MVFKYWYVEFGVICVALSEDNELLSIVTLPADAMPMPNTDANINNKKLGINNQKLILFNLGKAISGPPTNKGNKKLPNPPIRAGITMKNIITIA